MFDGGLGLVSSGSGVWGYVLTHHEFMTIFHGSDCLETSEESQAGKNVNLNIDFVFIQK